MWQKKLGLCIQDSRGADPSRGSSERDGTMRKVWILCVALLLLCCSACGTVSEAPTTETQPDNTVTVMFPEGSTVLQMAQLLEQNGVCTAESFLQTVDAAANEYTASIDGTRRPFLLEGYLFPDTYEFYKDSSPANVLTKFLSNLSDKWSQEMQTRADETDMTMDQALTLASIIQKEAGYTEEMPHVSSVLHNRLRRGMMLQCDVTYFYLQKTVMPYLFPDGAWEDDVYEHWADLYYTYRFAGLPEGPICNPGLHAIRAALFPSDTQDLYFVTDADGRFYYARTHDEHMRNCEEAKSAVSVPVDG